MSLLKKLRPAAHVCPAGPNVVAHEGLLKVARKGKIDGLPTPNSTSLGEKQMH